MSSTPGRNDPCPCGSGKKYKYCCMGSSGWLSSTTQARLLTVLTLAIGLIVAGLFLSQCGEDSSRCPPGQVWSEAHGHCH